MNLNNTVLSDKTMPELLNNNFEKNRFQSVQDSVTEYLKLIFKVMRPRAMICHIVIYLLYGTLIPGNLNNFWFWYNMFLVSIPYSIVIYGINDIYDYDTDIRNPRKQENWLGSVLKKEYQNTIMISVIISTFIIMLSAALSLNNNLIVTYAIMLMLGLLYSVPPVRLKTRPFFDSIANVFIYGLIMFVPFTFENNYFSFVISKISLGLPIIGLHILGALMDYKADIETNTPTIATKLGLFWSPIFIALFFILKPILFPFENNIYNYIMITISLGLGTLVFFHKLENYLKIVGTVFNIILVVMVTLSVGIIIKNIFKI